MLYRTYSRRTTSTRTSSTDFTHSDTLWKVGKRNPSSASEKWKMESNRKQRFRFGTRDRRWVLRKTRAKIGGHNWLPPGTRWIVLGLRWATFNIELLSETPVFLKSTINVKTKEEMIVRSKIVCFLAKCTHSNKPILPRFWEANQKEEIAFIWHLLLLIGTEIYQISKVHVLLSFIRSRILVTTKTYFTRQLTSETGQNSLWCKTAD